MPLEPGTRLARYEILARAGAGGMGEVYRARDTRLDRIVAIKVLPEQVAADPNWQARFEREARSVSGLSHPRICALYDAGEEDGVHFLVMEYLEGETLADRLGRGALSLRDALDCATQIAEALAAAHRAGLVHRDLKPGNVMLTRSGAKLLDFGLAKPLQAAAAGSQFAAAPTATSPLTAVGSVVGTFQYMAPEVLEGSEADARSDIFAFGAVLHEMVTGRHAFEGKTQASIVAAILKEETRPLSALVPTSPPALDRLVRRCLAKDPDERWQSASDLAKELEWLASGDTPTADRPPVAAPAPRGSSRLAWSLAALFALVAIALGTLALRPAATPPPRGAIRFDVPPPDGMLLRSMYETAAPVEVSPDGRNLVFGVMDQDGNNRLWLRPVDGEPRPLPGTEGASRPFWSPDSRSLGFFAAGELRRIDLAGGPPLTICATAAARGGSWNDDDIIVFARSSGDGLYKVEATGGKPERITELSRSPAESSHRYPSFLPDGRHFLYLALSSTGAAGTGVESEHRVLIGSLDGDPPRLVMQGASNTVYAAGQLVFRRGKGLQVRPFDPRRLEFTGEPRTLAESIQYDSGYERAIFTASDDVLAYVAGTFSGDTEARLVDRSGKPLRVLSGPSGESQSRFSPDGTRLASRISDTQGEFVWITDLERNVRTRLTFDEGLQGSPVWSPDGRRIAYGWNAGAGWGTAVRAADGGGEREVLVDESQNAYPVEWSPDGRYLLLANVGLEHGNDVWMLDLERGGEPRPLLEGPHTLAMPALSPDMRWLAYASDESGRGEVYVTRFPSLEGKWLVSENGGLEPLWDVDGKTLFYRGLNLAVMEVPLTISGAQLHVGAPRKLFDLYAEIDVEEPAFDLSRDGRMFVANAIPAEPLQAPITVIVDWNAR